MNTIPTKDESVIFKRSHFYAVMVVLAFTVGIFAGYIVWGRQSPPTQNVVQAQQPHQGAVVAPSVATQTTQVTQYDVIVEGFPSIGLANAPIVVVEFSDFQCPFCNRFNDETYRKLLEAYSSKIRFVFRHLPLISIHSESFPAAEASMCANEQNAFRDYYDKIFENQDKLGGELYSQIARDLQLDTSKFAQCVAARTYKDLVQQDSDFAMRLGIKSTPTFFVNGLALVGAQPFEMFKQVIDMELAGEIPE